MFKAKGKLFVFSGPSASGKGTLVERIIREREDTHLSISVTSREPRPGEIEGQSYFFITKDEFMRKIEAGELLEWAQNYGNYYGTPKEAVYSRLEQGQNVILEIDIQGALQMRAAYEETILIFVLPPDFEELKNRIIKRNSETPEKVKERLASCQREMEQISYYDYFIVNDDLDVAADYVHKLIDVSCLIVNDDLEEYIKSVKGEFQFKL